MMIRARFALTATLLALGFVFGVVGEQRTATLAHGDLRGILIYTADAFDSNSDGVIMRNDNDAMLSTDVGNGPAGRQSFIVYGAAESAAYPKLSRDGLRILCHAFIDTNNDNVIEHDSDSPFLAVLNVDGSDMALLSPPGEYAAWAADYSPDERLIAFSRADADTNNDGEVNTADIAHLSIKELGQVDAISPSAGQLDNGSEPENLITGNEFSVVEPNFLTNDIILFTGVDSVTGRDTAYMYDIRNRSSAPIKPPGLHPETETRNPRGSQDGTRVAVEVITFDEHYISVFDRVSNTWTRQSPVGLTAQYPTWSVDKLGMVVSDGSTWQIQIASGTGLQTLVDVDVRISATTFSPGGEAIAYVIREADISNAVLAVATLDGGYNALITPENYNVVDFAWQFIGEE